ncbi:extracellular solute-binding protein [Streptomyces sp. NBC_01754]|uniref:ABC transporter substrate-binding protein n=1 Tax=Streptomyces sp. NBC_01754 TaxID=2975930 RepID=UPI002DD86E1B|nr:extracellular solute-binding protein [Streptomyces sp. NBC_01754]WSC93053.1 extracellular solute-binding protein [Streptomyces sp. NBC_01754]
MKLRTMLAGTVFVVLSATSCAPGADSQAPAESAGPVKTGVPEGEVTLSLVSTPESGAAVKAVIKAFETKHPNVHIAYQDTNYDDYNKSLNLSLASDQAPDIALLNSVGTTVKDNLVRDLSPYAEAYGWDKTYAGTQLDQWRVGANGSTLGEGKLYAAPAGFSLVGVYYNKAKAAQLGITAPPADLDAFESALAKAKKAGEIPLQMGNAQGHASFPIQLVGQSLDGAEAAAKWTFGQKGATFDTAGNRAAVTKVAEWAEKGYLPASANGTDLQGATDKFAKGEGLFFVDGNWDAAKIGEKLGKDAGFFAFPGPKATAIGTSVAYAVSTHTEHPDAAAAFLDFLHSPEASAEQFRAGFMPADITAAEPADGTVMSDIVAAWAEVDADNGLVGFNNNATATMNDKFTATTQELLAGKTDTAGFIKAIQGEWAGTHG